MITDLFPYAILGLLPVFFCSVSALKPALGWIVLTWICFVLFMGFRNEVGPDWTGYLNLHAVALEQSWQEIYSGSEQLSMVLFRVSELAGTGMILTNIVSAILLITGVIAFARRTPLFWVAFSVCVPYLVLVFGMSGIRQGMAIGVTLFVLSKWDKWGLILKSIGVFCATLFHSSAIVMAVAVVFGMQIPIRYRVILAVPLLAAVAAVVAGVSQSDEVLTVYSQRHLGESQKASGGAFFHIALVAGPAIFALLNRKLLLPFIPFKDLFYLGCIASVALIPFGLISSTGASRLSLYLYFVPMLVYPAIVLAYFEGHLRAGQVRVCLSQAFLLVVWLLTANTAWPYMPYKTYLF